MKRFKTVEDVQKAFRSYAGGSDSIQGHNVRYGDIEKHKLIVERLLETDYNQISGFTFPEMMESISTIQSAYDSRSYVEEFKKGCNIDESLVTSPDAEYFHEGLEAGTTAQAPFPVPAVSLVAYQYEKSVIPFLAHMFDLKGNRGLIYYQEIVAENSLGNITAGDLLGSPKQLPKQNKGFVSTKVINKEVATTLTGTTHYELDLGASPQPGTVIIRVEGKTGFFMDVATADALDGKQAMLSVNGQLGMAEVNYATGEVTIDLAADPGAGKVITADFNRDIELAGQSDNIGKLSMRLVSKKLEAEQFGAKIDTNLYQEALSRALFGLDWNAEVDYALAALYNREVANKIVLEVKDKIIATSIATHDMSKGIVGTSAQSLGGNNALFNAQFVGVVLGKIKRLIADASGNMLNRLSAMVIHTSVIPVIENLPKYRAAENVFEDAQGGMVLIGLYDNVPVIAAYSDVLSSGEVIGIYKSKTKEFLTPYAFGTFVLPVIRNIYDQNNLATNHKQLIASAAGEVVAERLAAKLTINGIDEVI